MKFLSLILIALMTSALSLAGTDDHSEKIRLLQKLTDESGVEIRYDPEILSSPLFPQEGSNAESTLRYFDKNFSTIRRFDGDHLKAVDILPLGKTTATEMAEIRLNQTVQSTQSHKKDTSGPETSPEQNADPRQRDYPGKADVEKQTEAFKAREAEQTAKTVERLRELKAKHPDRYERSIHRYPPHIINRVNGETQDEKQ